MKNNKLLKTKKAKQIFYNDDYICINGNYMIHKAYIFLDDTLLQDKINKNEAFGYVSNQFINNIPPLKQLLPKNIDNYDLLEDTKLITSFSFSTEKYHIFYNSKANKCLYINEEYYQIFTTRGLVAFYGTDNPLTALIIYQNDTVKGLIMPCDVKNDFIQNLINKE
jgi:hypothetical protein